MRAFIFLCAVFSLHGAEYPRVLPPGTTNEGFWLSTNTPGVQAIAVKENGRYGAIKPVLIDALPSSTEFKLNTITTGQVEELKAVRYPLKLEAANPIRLEIFANRIGSQLDATLRILDGEGREVAFGDDGPFTGRDPALTFKPTNPGDYTIEIRDVAHGGGGNYFFALKAFGSFQDQQRAQLDEAEPMDLTLPVSLEAAFNEPGDRDNFRFNVGKDERWIFSTSTREGGSPCDAGLTLWDEKGALIAEAIGAEADGAAITNTFNKAGSYRLQVREISKLGGPGYNYRLQIEKFEPGVVVTTETESISGDGKIKFTAKRFGFDGPITITAPGVDLENATIPEKKNEIETKLKTAPTEARIVRFTAEAGGRTYPVSTEPALRKGFPLIMFPPEALEEWVAVNPATK